MHYVTESRIIYEKTRGNGFMMPILVDPTWVGRTIPIRLPEFIESDSLTELRKQKAVRLEFLSEKLRESVDFHFENLAYREEIELAHAYSVSMWRFDERVKKHAFPPHEPGCTFGTSLEMLAWCKKDRKRYTEALGTIPCIGEAGDQKKRIAAVNTGLLCVCYVAKSETDVAEVILRLLEREDVPLVRLAKTMCFHPESLGCNGKRKDILLPWTWFAPDIGENPG